jgi:hypothetical protein
VCERREIARSPYRALLGYDRQDVLVQQLEQHLDDDGSHAGMAGCEAVGLQQQHAPHDLRGQRRTAAAGMAANQVQLELARLRRRDDLARERAEAGVDAIGDLAARYRTLDRVDRCLHAAPRLVREASYRPR